MGHGTRDMGHGTRDMGHGTRDTGHGTRDTGHGTRGLGFGVRETELLTPDNLPCTLSFVTYSYLSATIGSTFVARRAGM